MSTAGPDQPIKLVIWDLDDTYWQGTLSEGAIEYSHPNQAIVVELSRRGIVNSICSKNDAEPVERELTERDAWQYFVFPRIQWDAKGPIIAQLLEDMGLRAVNVLFIDDNPTNRGEAEYYAPGIHVADPEIIPRLLEIEAFRGKSDPKLDRLRHYHLLARRAGERKLLNLSNEAFLRQSSIRVSVGHDVIRHKARVIELVNRTNQLNFTKQRLDESSLVSVVETCDDVGYVRVSDRFGDYGICGFFAMAGGQLKQFAFSCRILNMGVEQWVYQRLGAPSITVNGEVSSQLDHPEHVDWIEEIDEEEPSPDVSPGSHTQLFFKGGCDLAQVTDLFAKSHSIVTEFNGMLDNGFAEHREHTESLKRCTAGFATRYRPVTERVPWCGAKTFETAFFDAEHAVVVFSLMMDYTQGLYRYRDTDLVLPRGDFLVDLTSADAPAVAASDQKYPAGFFEWFRKEFRFEGAISEKQMLENLREFRARLAPHQTLILLNGAEVDLPHAVEVNRAEHHRRLNAIVERAVVAMPNTVICDVRRHVKTQDDVTDNIRHFHRRCYVGVADDLARLVSDHSSEELATQSAPRSAYRRARDLAWNVRKRLRGAPGKSGR